jgi:hypothetical protein
MRTAEHERALALAERWLENPPDMMGDPDCDQCVVARQLIRATERTEKIRSALEQSVQLQSHYANLLNMHDGGKRVTFPNADAWMVRLLSLDKLDPPLTSA